LAGFCNTQTGITGAALQVLDNQHVLQACAFLQPVPGSRFRSQSTTRGTGKRSAMMAADSCCGESRSSLNAWSPPAAYRNKERVSALRPHTLSLGGDWGSIEETLGKAAGNIGRGMGCGVHLVLWLVVVARVAPLRDCGPMEDDNEKKESRSRMRSGATEATSSSAASAGS